MCDLAAGQVIVTRPRGDGPAAGAASGAFFRIVERYRSHPVAQLDDLLERQPPPAWERSRRTDPPRQRHDVPFVTELLSVPEGAELSFVEEMRSEYLDSLLRSPQAVSHLAQHPHQRLSASPNWRLHRAGVPDAVSDPFSVGGHHASYLQMVGLHTATAQEAVGVTVAVLDNGFDSQFWQGAPTPVPVTPGQDLVPLDASTSGHGTLVAALVASSASGADVVPVRMAGDESTEWDTLHALAKAVQLGAHVVTLSYRQVLGIDVKCHACGLVRTAARSEVFARMLSWASDGGKRAIVAAAGNDGIGSIARPAAYQGAIPIAALDTSGSTLWAQSNWDGAGQHTVLALPGEDVALATSGTAYSGTSFATAYAAALYAVAMGRHRTTDASFVTQKLTTSSATVSNAMVPYLR